MKTYQLLPVITGLFTASLLLSETIASKIVAFGPFNLSAAILVFPLAYLINDILTEVYGYKISRRVIWTGFASLLLMVICYAGALALPSADFWGNQKAFEIVLGSVPRITFASIVSYFTGEFCNSYVLAKLKIKMEGKTMGVRFVVSTVVGEFIDSIIFFPLAFVGVLPHSAVFSLVFSAWIAKVLWEIVALPLTLPLVRWIKRIESEDYYDRGTDFNPLRF